MKLKIRNITEILDDSLTLIERGLLVSILLLKENDPKLTLAKCRAKIKFQDVRLELIKLHENGFIEWSGYKKAKIAEEEKPMDKDLLMLVNFMNSLYSRNFNPKLESTTKNLLNRMKENSVEDIKLVIANRYKVWKDDPAMSQYLQPTTIFRPSKFDKYLEEAKRTREGESFVSVQNLNIKNGETITLDIAHGLSDNDTYNIKTYRTNETGEKSGLGMESVRYGRDIKRTLLLQEKEFERGGRREFIYTYQTK